MAAIIKDWFCELCKLQFDKKVVFDLHQKLVHGIDSIRLVRVKEKRAQLCTENSINTNELTPANLDFTEVPMSSSTIESSNWLCQENSITTNNSTPCERKDKNNMHDMWVPSHEKYATAACTTATIDITEEPMSNAVGSSSLESSSCQTTSTNLDITNFVSSITFDDEKNLDIKVEHKHDPGITSLCHKDTRHAKAPCRSSLENFDQQRQNVEANTPSNNLSRIEKLTRMCVNFDLSNSKANKVECEYCQEVYSTIKGYENHIETCKLYCKYLIKTSKGFRCSICSTVKNSKNRMVFYNHMRIKHADISDESNVVKEVFQNGENAKKDKLEPIESELGKSSLSIMSPKVASNSTPVPSVNSSVSKKYTEDQYLEMVGKRKHGCLIVSKTKVQGVITKRNVSNTVEMIDLDKSDSIPKRGRNGEDITCKLCLRTFCYNFRFYEHLKKDHAIDPLEHEKFREDEKELIIEASTSGVKKSQNFYQNRQNVKTNLPSNNLSRMEKPERMNLSNSHTSKAPFVTSMEYSGQRPNETKNLSRIEVIEKLASMNINFDLSTSLTDLQNLLRENLIKLFKCKEPVTTASQSTGSLLKSKDSESSTVSRRSELDIIEVQPSLSESSSTKSDTSNENQVIDEVVEIGPEDPTGKAYPETFKEIHNLSRNEVIEKLASLKIPFDLRKNLPYLKIRLYNGGLRVNQGLRVNHYSKKKVQGIAMKRNVSNSEETINLDKSDVAKRSRMDEDVTCKLCSQAFWYKSQLYEHLEKEHDIHDAVKYVKSREDKKKHLKKEHNTCDLFTPLRNELLCQLFRVLR